MTSRQVYVDGMAIIVLRVQLVGGNHVDVTFEREESIDEGRVVDQIVDTLAVDGGALRCQHGGRLLVLYGRGVAAIEVAPRGAVV
jgi:hypothetical protein